MQNIYQFLYTSYSELEEGEEGEEGTGGDAGSGRGLGGETSLDSITV